MANKIVLKKSSVVGKVPTSGDLDIGELAVNLADEKLYTKNASDTVIELGKGNVVGPASATDNAITRYDGTTGKLVQNSTVTIDDNGNVIGTNAVSFDTTPTTPPATEGTLFWDADKGALAYVMQGGDVTQEIGESQYMYIEASANITKGQVVMFTGAVGGSGIPTGAPATGVSDGTYIMGIAAEDITSGTNGFVQTFGILKPVNTTGIATGTILWYDPTVTGGLTPTKPTAPNIKVQMAAVTAGNSSGGALFIRVTAGSELGSTDSNVLITSPTSGNTLIYDATAGVWKNANLSAGSGITITEGAGTITIASTGSAGGSYTRTSFTATSGQTVFTVSYTVGYIEVFLNGVLLNSADYTATNGTSVTLATGATTGDIVEFIAYNALAVGLAVGLQGGTAGQIPYQTAPDTTSFITNGTTGQILTSNGSSEPTWENRTQYISITLSNTSVTQVPTSNGYLGILLSNGSTTTQVPIA